jgi:hypothetical protein
VRRFIHNGGLVEHCAQCCSGKPPSKVVCTNLPDAASQDTEKYVVMQDGCQIVKPSVDVRENQE